MHVAVKHAGTHSRKGEQASTRVEGIRGQRHATETSGLDVPTKQSRCHGRRQDVANGFLRNDAWRVVGIRGQVKPFLFDRSLDFTNHSSTVSLRLPEFRLFLSAPEQAGRKVHEQAWTGGQEQHTRASTELTPRTRRNGDGRKGTQGG